MGLEAVPLVQEALHLGVLFPLEHPVVLGVPLNKAEYIKSMSQTKKK